MKDTVNEFTLTTMPNGLYSQFMSDVDDLIVRITPDALRIKKCYQAFQEGRAELDEVFVRQRKDNRTVKLANIDALRDRIYRSVLGHTKADLISADPEKQDKARILLNKIEAYGYLIRLGNNEESARMSDLLADLTVFPYKEIIESLGLTSEVKAMDEANRAFIALSRERTNSNKTQVSAVKEVRRRLDSSYREMIAVVNSQLTLRSLMDEATDDGPVVVGLSEETDLSGGPLMDFVMNLNAIIREYKTKVNQSGSRSNKRDEKPVV